MNPLNPLSSKGPMGRREFLRGGVRYALLGGLAAMAAYTVARPKGAKCVNRSVCGGCPAFLGCELPQALSAKKAGVGSPAAAAQPISGYREVWRIPGGSVPSRDLEMGPGDQLYLAMGNGVAIFDAAGRPVGELPLETPARCVAVAGDGTVYAGTRNRVAVFDASGKRTGGWDIPAPRTWLTGLAVGESGLFAADAGNRVVLRYDLSGRLLGRIGAKDEARGIPGFVIPSPYFSVKLHPDGLLRVNNPGRHRVEVYTVDGDFEGAWGRASGAPDGFCGCCNPTRLALLPDGRVLTCEKGVPRVKIHRASGEFEAVVAGAGAFPENARVGAGQRDADSALAGLSAAADARGRIAILDHVTGEVRLLEAMA